jgi:hypothetical protein
MPFLFVVLGCIACLQPWPSPENGGWECQIEGDRPICTSDLRGRLGIRFDMTGGNAPSFTRNKALGRKALYKELLKNRPYQPIIVGMNFATLHFDTYKVVNLLVSKGYTKDEAEGFIEAIQEVTLSGVATKQDVDDVKHDLKQEIHDVRNDMLKFQLIQTTTLIGVMVALFAFF